MDQNFWTRFFKHKNPTLRAKHPPQPRPPLLSTLLPNHCFLCQSLSPQTLCPACEQDLPLITRCCRQCALPLEHSEVCGECLKHPPVFDHSICRYRYEGHVPALINLFKHQNQWPLGRYLAQALALQLGGNTFQADALIPVPLHWRTQIHRGYNQAAIICQELTLTLDIPIVHAAHKTKPSPHQQGLSRKQRLANHHRPFHIQGDISGMNVLLVDDVITTGATVQTLSRALKEAGAKAVNVCALARTPKNH